MGCSDSGNAGIGTSMFLPRSNCAACRRPGGERGNTMNSTRTIQGQAWDQIAREAWGSELLMDRLTAGNVDEADVLLFSGNTALDVPEVSTADARRASVQPAPWER